MESTNRQLSFERGPPNQRSPPPLTVAAESISPIDVTMFAWLKSPSPAASSAPPISTRPVEWYADVTPTPAPVIPPILSEDKPLGSGAGKKGGERRTRPNYRLSTIWTDIAKTLGSSEHLLDLLRHYRDEGRDAALKKEIEDSLRSHIPAVSQIGNILEQSIRILSQQRRNQGEITKNHHFFKKVKAALKHRQKFLASAGATDQMAVAQGLGAETRPAVIGSGRKRVL
ncbi:hypothetical protein DFP73DRAFT_622297 [Morchella snyderi]|nr:hypothetical protein DFP73DRAFT_622297 [Morchella snyderi]